MKDTKRIETVNVTLERFFDKKAFAEYEQQNYLTTSLDYTTSLRWTTGFILVLTAAYFIFRTVLRKYFDEQMKSLHILFFNDDITANGSARANVEHQLHNYIHKYYRPGVITEYMQQMKPLDGPNKKSVDLVHL
ncbi:hypothetical protein LOAG_12030 [Loa loa]|uniref:Uncharacterized protein n=1 Tax=Loa loa TaxID=7209 RepID=A0A1S0TLW5_LOALO|nr:hypothetical protein LOAG_12030 [Loa loa]EFO16478.1 hypothetical protein LOAG_12030 [Loa loa]